MKDPFRKLEQQMIACDRKWKDREYIVTTFAHAVFWFFIAFIVSFAMLRDADAQEREKVPWRQVRIVELGVWDGDAAGCEFIGNVSLRFNGGTKNVATRRLARQAGNDGANVLALRPDEEGKAWIKGLFTGFDADGEAWYCERGIEP